MILATEGHRLLTAYDAAQVAGCITAVETIHPARLENRPDDEGAPASSRDPFVSPVLTIGQRVPIWLDASCHQLARFLSGKDLFGRIRPTGMEETEKSQQ